jgi:hypothetical protein
MFEYKVGDVVLYSFHSPSLKVVDILGSGVRLSDKSFGLTSVGVDDCVYFFFEYDVSTIKPLAPAIQMHVRYFDPLGRRVIRVCSIFFSTVDNMLAPWGSVDGGLFVSSIIMKAVDQYREFGTLKSAEDFLRRFGETFLGDPLCALHLANGAKPLASRTQAVLAGGHRLMESLCVPALMGRAPDDVVACFAPVAFPIDLETMSLCESFFVYANQLPPGVYYIKMGGRRAVVFVSRPDCLEQVVQLCQSGRLVEVLGEICDDLFVEVLVPGSSHPLLRHLVNCCRGP